MFPVKTWDWMLPLSILNKKLYLVADCVLIFLMFFVWESNNQTCKVITKYCWDDAVVLSVRATSWIWNAASCLRAQCLTSLEVTGLSTWHRRYWLNDLLLYSKMVIVTLACLLSFEIRRDFLYITLSLHCCKPSHIHLISLSWWVRMMTATDEDQHVNCLLVFRQTHLVMIVMTSALLADHLVYFYRAP